MPPPDVTLGADLLRRDLTINALAQDENGHIIDVYGGQNDLRDRLLRHISPAFSEDPLRVLRVARFAARYAHLGFRIAEETKALMDGDDRRGRAGAFDARTGVERDRKRLNYSQPAGLFPRLRDCQAAERCCSRRLTPCTACRPRRNGTGN